jgi:hypothetical protein
VDGHQVRVEVINVLSLTFLPQTSISIEPGVEVEVTIADA